MFKIPPNLKIQQDKSVGAYYPRLLIVYVTETAYNMDLNFPNACLPLTPPSSQGCYKDKK